MTSNMENTYSIKTLVGNWQEWRTREEDKRALFLDKCKHGQLSIQKMALLQDTFLKHIPTSGLRDKHLHFEDQVGLVCPPPTESRVRVNHSLERPRVIISVDLDESLIYGAMKLSEGVALVGTTLVRPVTRSVFKVISPGCCPKDCKITYGAPVQFMFAAEGLADTPLYMASDAINTAGGANYKSGRRRVFLNSEKFSYNTQWKFEHMDPQNRLEMEGQPVPVNAPLVIRHLKTNSALAIEHDTISGFFGREYEVSTCDHLDGHRAENDTNLICVCTNLEICESPSDNCQVIEAELEQPAPNELKPC